HPQPVGKRVGEVLRRPRTVPTIRGLALLSLPLTRFLVLLILLLHRCPRNTMRCFLTRSITTPILRVLIPSTVVCFHVDFLRMGWHVVLHTIRQLTRLTVR